MSLLLLQILLSYLRNSLQGPQHDRLISQEFFQPSFNSQDGWTISPINNNPFIECGIFGTLFGGTGVFDYNTEITKTYSWVDTPHYALQYDFNIYKIDSWDAEDKVEVYLENNLIIAVVSNYLAGNCNVCGSTGYNDEELPFSYSINHNSNTLSVKFKGIFDQDEESYGLRDIILKLKMCDTTCASCTGPENNKCNSCYQNSKLSNGICSCIKYYYSKDNYAPSTTCEAKPCSSCMRCHISCATCNGPLSTNCLSCDSPDTLINNACQAPYNAFILESSFKSATFTDNEVNSWITNPTISAPLYSTCGSYQLLGGYQKFGNGLFVQKLYSGVSPFYAMRFKLLFLKIDSWENETFEIYVEKLKISKNFGTASDDTATGNQCGNPSFDEVECTFSEYFGYIGNGFSLKLTTTLNQDASDESWGFSNFEITLYVCDYTCYTCSEPTKCTSCYSHATILDGLCSCIQGYYMDKTTVCSSYPCSTCFPCSSSCNTCSGISTKCLSCVTGKYLSGNNCLPCNSPCKSCEGTANSCTSCNSPNYLESNLCVATCSNPKFGNNQTRTCELTCPSNQYGDTTANRVCELCDANCEKCFGTATNCLSCLAPRYLDGTNCNLVCSEPNWGDDCIRSCVPNCMSTNMYGDPNDRICKECSPTCKTCLNTADHCTSCDSPLYLNLASNACLADCQTPLIKNDETRKCDSSCPNLNQFINAALQKCEICDASCKTCENSALNCLTCEASQFLYANRCYNQCPEPTWGNSIAKTCGPDCPSPDEFGDLSNKRICAKCDANCKSCTTSAQTCTSCIDGLFLENSLKKCLISCPEPLWGSSDTNICEANCKVNEFADLSDLRKCKICDSNCLQCSGTAKNCISCSAPNYLHIGSCLLSCTPPFWGNNSTRTCENQCLNQNEYGDAGNNRICKVCDGTCKSCTETPTKCTSCAAPLYLSNLNVCQASCTYPYVANEIARTCELGCINNHFWDMSDGKCKECSLECKTCEGASNMCKSCYAPQFLYQSSCLKTCPELSYGDPTTNECLRCPGPCRNCFLYLGKISCKDCYEGQYFDESSKNCVTVCPPPNVGLISERRCVDKCENGFFSGNVDRICRKCAESCRTCESTDINCTGCNSPLYFYQGSCYKTCPGNKIPNNETRVCSSCMDYCRHCDDLISCRECETGYYLYLKNMSCSKCEQAFLNKIGKNCIECASNCEECSREGFCMRCLPEYILADVNDCKKVLVLAPELLETDFLSVLRLNFKTNDAPNIVKRFGSLPVTDFLFKIENLSSENFSFQILDVSQSDFYFKFIFKANVSAGTLITLEITPQAWIGESSPVRLTKYTFQTRITRDIVLCGKNEIFEKDRCKFLKKITPSLSISDNPQIIHLFFDEEFLELFDIIDSVTETSIEGLHEEDFSFKIAKTSKGTDRTFDLSFAFNIPSTKTPLLSVYLNLPLRILSHPTYFLSTTNLTIRMKSFFRGVSINSEEIKEAKESTSTASDLAAGTTYATSLASAGSSIAFRSLLLMDSIKFLRFLDINYPENALLVFEAKLVLIPFWPQITVEKDDRDPDPAGKFLVYQINPYLLNNIGPTLSQTALILLIAILLKYAQIHPNFLLRHKYFALIVYFLQRMFVWNFVFVILLSNFQNICVYTFVSLKWPSWYSPLGIANLIFAISSFLGILWLIYFIFLRVRQLRQDFDSKTPRTIPILPPLLTQGLPLSFHKADTNLKELPQESERHFEKEKLCMHIDPAIDEISNSLDSNTKALNKKLSEEHIENPRFTADIINIEKQVSSDDSAIMGKVISPEEPEIEETKTQLDAIKEVKSGMFNKKTVSEWFLSRTKFSANSEKAKATEFKTEEPLFFDSSSQGDIKSRKQTPGDKLNGTSEELTKPNGVDFNQLQISEKLSYNANKGSLLESKNKSPNSLENFNPETYSDHEEEEDEKRNKRNEVVYNAAGNLKRNSYAKYPSRIRRVSSTQIKKEGILRRLSAKITQSFSNKISPVDEKIVHLEATALTEKKLGLLRRISMAVREKSNVFFNRSRRSEFRMNYLIFYRDYKQEKAKYAFYLVFDLLRHFFLSAVLVFLYEYPFQQIIIICFTNFSIFSYLVLVRPFSGLKDLFMNTINEGAIVVGCIACLVMAIMDRINDDNNERRMQVGACIFYINMILMLVFTTMFFIDLLLIMKELLMKFLNAVMEKRRLNRK